MTFSVLRRIGFSLCALLLVFTATARAELKTTLKNLGEIEKPKFEGKLPSLLDFEGTNEVVKVETPAQVIDNPALAALARLEAMHAESSSTNALEMALPRPKSIFNLDSGPVVEQDEVSTLVENIKVKDLLEEADAKDKAGEADEAITLLEASVSNLKQKTSQFQIYNRIGLLYYGKKDYNKAAENMNLALKVEPGSPSLSCNLAAILLYQNKTDEALKILNEIPLKAVSDKSLLFSAHFNYACAYSLSQQTQESLTHLELAARYDQANTYTSMSDSQLDNVRDTQKFKEIKKVLSNLIDGL